MINTFAGQSKAAGHLLSLILLTTGIVYPEFSLADQDKSQPNTFVMASGKSNEFPASIFREKIYRELFKRIGIPLRFKWNIPIRRMSEQTETGKVDGQVARVYEYQKKYPTQIRVNIPLYKQNFVAYTWASKEIQISDGWEGLRNAPYNVEYRRGVLFAKNKLSELVSPDLISTVTTVKQGLNKLMAGRTDIFVHANLTAWQELHSAKFKNAIKANAVLSSTYMYPYVHNRHRALVPVMEKTLKTMKNEGLIKKYCIETFGEDATELCDNIE